MKQTILVDMDGVLADYSGEFKRRWEETHPDKPLKNWEVRKHHDIDDNYPEYREVINDILLQEDFFEKLETIPGAVQGLEKLTEQGTVYICTAPSLRNKHCVSGKYAWITKHLGKKWVEKTIITKDKTIIPGTYLIDDKPEVTGAQRPAWEHLVFKQPYNRHITHNQRVSWDSIEEFLTNRLERASYRDNPSYRTGT